MTDSAHETHGAHPHKPRPRPPEKLTTSKLARKLGVQSTLLLNGLVGRGFIVLTNGRKQLTEVGRSVGGEEVTHRAKGRFIVWPQDLLLKLLR